MYNKISLVKNKDNTFNIHLYYITTADTEFSLDFLYSDKIKNNINNLRIYLNKHAKDIKIKTVKILINGTLIATMSLPSFMKVYGANEKYSMAYIYSGNQAEQVSYIDRTKGSLNTISPTYLDIYPNGTLKLNSISTNLINHAHSKGMKVVPFLSNHWDKESAVNALINRESLSTEIANIINIYNLDGVNVDIEAIDHNYKNEFTDFVAKLRSKIPKEKEVSVAVAANPNGWTNGWHGLYDYNSLAKHADYLMVMAYDESWQGSDAGPVASGNFVERSITYALSKTSPDKIVLGMPFYGRIWSNNGLFNGNGIKQDVINEFVLKFGGTSIYDSEKQSVRSTFTVTNNNHSDILHGKKLIPGTYTIWHENEESIKYKMSLINKYNLKGAGSWALGQETVSIWDNYSNWLNFSNTSGDILIATKTGIVTADKLNIRSGPGSNYSVIGMLTENSPVQIIDLTGDWYKIKITDTALGYVHSSYIKETANTAEAVPPKEETVTTKTGVVTATLLNVRNGPSTSNNIITTLKNKDIVHILSTEGGWHKIKLSNGEVAYVSATYVDTNPVALAPTTLGTVTASALNIRSSPSTNANILGLLKNGDKVNILSTNNGWHSIKLPNGGAAYVSAQYVSLNQTTSQTGVVTASLLNLRASPSTSSKILTTLKRNTLVNILSTSNGWHYVKLPNAVTGFVSSEYIGNSEVKTRNGFVNTAILNVRAAPSTNSKVLTTLKRNTLVNIISTSNGWHKIILSNGGTGYVYASLIR